MSSFSRFCRRTVVLGAAFYCAVAEAGPVKPVVTQGGAVITTQGSQTTIQTSGNTFINWASFNIGANESTTFIQPSASSVVWNRINDPHPSQILGRLDANGYVVLQNQSGFFVGGQAVINAAGLLMTTSPSVPPDISSGGAWQFNAPPPAASIINYGQLNAGPGGSIFLIGHDIENHGTLNAPAGNIGLYAGKQVLMCTRPDGRGLSAQVTLPEGSVDNTGKLIADAGTIALHAQVVNQGGLVQADSVREHNGIIEVVASDAVNLGPSSVIEAKGGSSAPSSGGSLLIKSDNQFNDSSTSSINVSGGVQGGNGGQVEISATQMDAITSQINGNAAPGYLGGRLVIDPVNITLSATGTSATSGTINSGDAPASLTLNVNSFSTFSQILLQASQNITLNTVWSLADSLIPGTLTLQAGNNITLDNGRSSAAILAGRNWSVNLVAGANFTAPTSVTSGVGGIYLNGNSFVQTQDGSIAFTAGKEVLLQNPLGLALSSQGVRTLAGGSINVSAVSGNVNAGSNPNGYRFGGTAPGYTVSTTLGGISTAAGGDVTISAGGDVTSFTYYPQSSTQPPGQTTSPTDAGSGAFGSAPGVVTVTAGLNPLTGGNVFGHFVAADSERNGQLVASSITAHAGAGGQGGNAGAPNNLLDLSLAKGGWQVNAGGNIYLNEVRNPNGVFNGTGFGSAPFKHLFNYDPHSFVDLQAPNGGVFLQGALLPRFAGDSVQVIYPPTLTINAGAGGVNLGNDVTLFPSPFGELNISTTSGGSLEGAGHLLSMSDSAATRWTSATDFSETDHAPVPVELNNQNPVVFVISGNVDNITLNMSKETQMTVHGEMDNTSFTGQNLHSTDITSLHVDGRIFNQNIYTFEDLSSTGGLPLPPPRFPGDVANYFQIYNDAVVPGSGPGSPNSGALFTQNFFVYNPATMRLGYFGKMDPAIEQALLGTFQVKTYTLDGQVVLDANGNYVTRTASFGMDPAKLVDLYTQSQFTPDPSKGTPQGYQLGGPGQFNITAQSLDLGITQGIVSEGPAVNPFLAPLSKTGATINVNLFGDLNMFSSSISSLYGGDINIFAGGSINVGSQELLSGGDAARGIWSSGHSDVNVEAVGDIDVAGSRIAAFAGGNVNVKSDTGSVDAGSGGENAVKVNEVIVDPNTLQVTTPQQPIAGSGILATTLPDAPIAEHVGNITVLAPQGNINASAGGIVQEPLNGNTSLVPAVTLVAGTRATDGSVIHAGDINAGESGVIGVNTILNAAGNINGLVIARGDSTVNAAANVTGTFLAGGTASFNAGGVVSGIAIAGNAINVGSGTFEGVALSQNVSGGGAQTSLASSATASAGSQTAAATQENAQKQETSLTQVSSDDERNRTNSRPLLAKTVSRVTVILPATAK